MNNALQELFCDCYNYYFVVPTFLQSSLSNSTSVSDFLYFPECFSTTPREKARQAQWNKLFIRLWVIDLYVGRKKKDSYQSFFPAVKSIVHHCQDTKCLVAALHSGLLRLLIGEINHLCLVNDACPSV